ncbi:MAG: membrane protein insertase YidC [Cytophagales bacterium]|uniref:Membrane protein insertase YidC n=1 Tax=Algoriphagus taiwanensis TaxID=1445656 RepID=A0ABQ6Q1U0_9BACT|nr:MAG: membrane protein insertase YidC [Cytophagales bacterium]GMQ34157.1 membrane protein insertase YidC [Algoriphagus taiwanensis]
MDRNQATGLILFAAVILIYSIFFASGPELPPAEQEVASTEVASALPETQEIAADSNSSAMVDSLRFSKFGVLAALAQGEEQEAILETEELKITFSTKGAQIKQVELKEFKDWQMNPLLLLDEKSSQMSLVLDSRMGEMNLADFYFQPKLEKEETEEGTIHRLTFTAGTESGTIKQIFTLKEGEYLVNKTFEVQNFQGVFTGNSLNFSWEDQVKAHEKDLAESRRKSQVNYYLSSGSYENLGLSDDLEEASVAEPVKWIGFSQRFFTAGIIADSEFRAVNLSQSTPADSSVVRTMSAALAIPFENGKSSFSFYFGPDKYKTLKQVTEGFEENVDMGYFFVSWVNKYIVVHLFEFLEKYFSNYGIIIILIVFIIKLALSPLTYKSYIGMAKMRVIKPEIDELKEKYGEDPTKMQQEQMKLFSQLGVSPISGCLPLLLQMPFLFAMFFFFPNAIELRQESFLWAKDLSTYDEFIKLPFTIPFYGAHVSLFTLLMTVSQIIYTHFNNQLTTATGPMKNLGYIMPVMFMFILNSYPAGLSFYYFVSNVFTFGQQALIKLFVDDAKIREKVEQNKVKNVNKKKSKFQQRLEDAMKAAEANKKK